MTTKVTREKGGFWVGFAAAVFYPAIRLFSRNEFRGGDRLPREGGALVVFNHISEIDPVYDAVAVHSAGRVPRFMAKHSLWKVPVVGSLLRGAGQIPVYRGSGDAQRSLRAAVEGLGAGKVVVIYPEGTVGRDPERWPMYSKTGVARLALDTDVPVIPAVNWGTHEVHDYQTKKFRPSPRRRRVVVEFGEPVDLDAYRGRPRDAALLREVTDAVMSGVRDLLGSVRNETPPVAFHRPGGRSGTDSAASDGDAAGSATDPVDGAADAATDAERRPGKDGDSPVERA
ncbi:lysophospholipid acyltransferase family protein [Actinoalloteichus caeruleus]|uniref:lysophospholipid acyltransferase family protein n=1 Tax=Actinoalloteichus cyanogriseus TaxID=2893586 RepID=UPI003BB99582